MGMVKLALIGDLYQSSLSPLFGHSHPSFMQGDLAYLLPWRVLLLPSHSRAYKDLEGATLAPSAERRGFSKVTVTSPVRFLMKKWFENQFCIT